MNKMIEHAVEEFVISSNAIAWKQFITWDEFEKNFGDGINIMAIPGQEIKGKYMKLKLAGDNKCHKRYWSYSDHLNASSKIVLRILL